MWADLSFNGIALAAGWRTDMSVQNRSRETGQKAREGGAQPQSGTPGLPHAHAALASRELQKNHLIHA